MVHFPEQMVAGLRFGFGVDYAVISHGLSIDLVAGVLPSKTEWFDRRCTTRFKNATRPLFARIAILLASVVRDSWRLTKPMACLPLYLEQQFLGFAGVSHFYF